MKRVGDYEMVEKIGAGGMGEVWRGENVHTKLRCAVKLLPQEATQDKNFVARFFDEGRVMAELDHPRIVRVHHVGYDETLAQYFLVMDYVEGPQGTPQSLQSALEQSPESRLPATQVRRWAMQTAEGLAYAHGRGVVHRDIKPANILIDKEGNARITDYGLVKAVGQEFVMSQIHQSIQQTMSGTLSDTPTLRPAPQRGGKVEATLSDQETIAREEGGSSHRSSAESLLGTYDYMSPEQRGELHGVEVGPASDIYSFGVMSYRILTGRRPTGRAKRASQIVRGLPKRWDVITDRCLEHQPSDRYPDGRALLAAIQEVGQGGGAARGLAKAAVFVVVLAAIVAAGHEVWTWYQGRRPEARQTNRPVDEPGAQRQAEIAALFKQAKRQYESGEYAQALVTLGRLEALTPPDANSASLRVQIEQAMRVPPNKPIQQEEPVLVAESGTIRITAASTLPGDDYLARQRAQVRIDGGVWREVSLPHIEQGLSCESHTVELRLSGYQPVQAKQVTVRDGQQSPIEFGLAPMPGSATIACNVSGAEVFDGTGRRLGAAGERLTLAAFTSHELKVKAPRHRDASVTVRIDRPGMDAGSQRVTLEEIRSVVVGGPWTVADVDMAFVYVQPGSIRVADSGRGSPARTVQADRGYWIGAREVTNAQYQRFVRETGYDGRREGGSEYLRHQRDRSRTAFAEDRHPVIYVSWDNAAAFCRWLTERERAAGRLPQGYLYALPTEAEWEYAARGGRNSRQFQYAGGNAPDAVAWYAGNSGGVTQATGRKAANEIGIFDMSGNVSEWCHDWYTPDDSGQDPPGSSATPGCVVRGGSWQDPPDQCRCSARTAADPGSAHVARGFRVVLVTQDRAPRTVPRIAPAPQPQRKKENRKPGGRLIPIP
ncbi:MAG: SUMF1/EgtB/PvdO family nonheme iron enzyme [Sedimentisphaerales bacterium]|nr:SUMF1/EgtB/PvdO family nonheme iron enzyme [Sedimentisphaerales bacterium]